MVDSQVLTIVGYRAAAFLAVELTHGVVSCNSFSFQAAVQAGYAGGV